MGKFDEVMAGNIDWRLRERTRLRGIFLSWPDGCPIDVFTELQSRPLVTAWLTSLGDDHIAEAAAQ
jgi:hypothetical protein